jgi:hypothetical protein
LCHAREDRGFQGKGDESNERDAISKSIRRQRPATELEMFDVGTSDVDGYEWEDCDHADVHADEEEEVSQVDD